MENKRYLDKVVEHLVRSTKIDYEKGSIKTPYDEVYTTDLVSLPSGSLKLICMVYFINVDVHTMNNRRTYFKFIEYCVNQFGLTVDEVEYVWEQYRNIINEKI